MENIVLYHEYGWYDLIKIFGFDSIKEDLVVFSLKEDLVQILSKIYSTKKIYLNKVILDVLVQPVEHDAPACVLQYLVSVNKHMLWQFLWIRDTCGTRCSNMCATSGPSSAGQCYFIFGAKVCLRFNQICFYILAMCLCDLFDSCWISNQFK